ncbi:MULTISPECIES: gamma carbonic anhydrase family protein [unclassified Leucobacter]|uniref:gamma carbonic anhydrase family protein n=1 Tax=unclassified Leucobacter TaxID=2621730 RepID=UPI00165E000B|nr:MULTISPECIES: gamma carbonic anhydrase family protein [unclassified Leucobacter]MBC9926709.1 gamma carbonic anhydrase family protein [Leucobacter sp. cx-169]
MEPSQVWALSASQSPEIHPSAWIAPSAVVIGAVELGPDASVWYNAVLRGDSDRIVIGARSNLQDGVAVHVDRGHPVTLGSDVSVGHNAIVHGATVADGCLIGMGATILSGAMIGAGSLIAAGALVAQGKVIPPGSLVAGVPGKVVRQLSAEERAGLITNAALYLGHVHTHRAAHSAREESLARSDQRSQTHAE